MAIHGQRELVVEGLPSCSFRVRDDVFLELVQDEKDCGLVRGPTSERPYQVIRAVCLGTVGLAGWCQLRQAFGIDETKCCRLDGFAEGGHRVPGPSLEHDWNDFWRASRTNLGNSLVHELSGNSCLQDRTL